MRWAPSSPGQAQCRPLLLRQREGFLSANPAGRNALGAQFERVLPASSTANLYPSATPAAAIPMGLHRQWPLWCGYPAGPGPPHTGQDQLQRAHPGQLRRGQNYLLKLLICNLLESGKTVICLDPEQEADLALWQTGWLLRGPHGRRQFRINFWRPSGGMLDGEDDQLPEAFRQKSSLSQHISFLKDFFRAYKPFTHQQVDTLELMLERLYRKWGISDKADFSAMGPEDWPIAEDLYAVLEDAYEHYDRGGQPSVSPGSAAGAPAGAPLPCAGGGERLLQQPHEHHQH